MSLRYLIPLLALVNAVSVPPAVAQETQEATTVTVTGNVVNDGTGQPVAGVVVVLEALGLTMVTDAQGQFVLDSVPRGVYDLRLIHKDYQSLDVDARTKGQKGEHSPVAGRAGSSARGMAGTHRGRAPDAGSHAQARPFRRPDRGKHPE